MLDGEHPYYSCCKREKLYDKNNNLKLGKPLHCKQSDDLGLTGLRCLYPDEGKKRTLGGDTGSLGPDSGNIGGGGGLGPKSTRDQGSSPTPPSKVIIHGATQQKTNGNGNGPSPGPGGGGGKKSSNLPLILGITGGSVGAVILLVYLVMTKRLKL